MSFEFEIPKAVRQILAVALLLLPVAGLVMALWSYESDILQHRTRVVLLEREKAQYEALQRAAPAWNRELARLRRAVAGGRLLYTGKTVDGDAEKMQARIAALVASAGVKDAQDRIAMGTSSADGPTQLRDDVTFSGTMAQLRAVLYQLKQSRPLLFAERLTIHAGSPDNPEPLRVELQILGFASPS